MMSIRPNFSLTLLDLVFVTTVVSVPGRLVCHLPSSPLTLTCSPSDPDLYFHQLVLVAFVVVHVTY